MRLELGPGPAHKSKIRIQGHGIHLDLQPLPAMRPVTGQPKSGDVTCRDAV